jgi:competence protein ComEC
VGVAGLRTASVAEPVLPFRYYGPIEGRIVVIDRSQSDKPRLTLDRVVLADVAPDRTPTRVRVSLHGAQGGSRPSRA